MYVLEAILDTAMLYGVHQQNNLKLINWEESRTCLQARLSKWNY